MSFSPKRRRIHGPESSDISNSFNSKFNLPSTSAVQPADLHLPPTPFPIPPHASDPIPAETASTLLAISCAQILRQTGFTGWTASAGLRFQGLVEEFLTNATREIARYTQAARRSSPTPQDFFQALPNLRKLDPTGTTSLSTPPRTPPEQSSIPNTIRNTPPVRKRKRAPTIPSYNGEESAPLPLTPPSSPSASADFSNQYVNFMGPGPVPSGEIFPESCPPMPPAHTYCFTPVEVREQKELDDKDKFRERVRQEGKKGEGALRGLLKKLAEAGGEKQKGFGKRRKEREAEWDAAWRACLEEDGQEADEIGEVANYEKVYWRKGR